MELSEHTQQHAFTIAVEHYCEGLIVATGCLGQLCEYADGDENHSCEPCFSWQGCDSCGSTLGGDRFKAYGLDCSNNDIEPIEMDICVDCAMYHANGELPETWQ